MNGNMLYQSQVDDYLLNTVLGAGLMQALVDVRSFRVKSYWRQPQLMLRDGWALSPEINPRRDTPRSWVLGNPQGVGQKLSFDRNLSRVRLTTFNRRLAHELVLDINTNQVVSNRML